MTGEKFAPRAPDVFIDRDVGHEDRHIHHVRHLCAGGFQAMLYLGEDYLGLFVCIVDAVDGLEILSAGGESGEIDRIADANAVRPVPRRIFGDVRRDDALLLGGHRNSLSRKLVYRRSDRPRPDADDYSGLMLAFRAAPTQRSSSDRV